MVVLVSFQTYQLAHVQKLGVAVVAFLISFMWCLNVKTALGSWPEKLTYCLGASAGAVTGLELSLILYG